MYTPISSDLAHSVQHKHLGVFKLEVHQAENYKVKVIFLNWNPSEINHVFRHEREQPFSHGGYNLHLLISDVILNEYSALMECLHLNWSSHSHRQDLDI